MPWHFLHSHHLSMPGHGPADNRGHVRPLPDTSIPLSTWRNAGCQPLPHRLVFPDTESVIGATPGHHCRDHLRTGRVGAKLCKLRDARSALGPCHNGRARASVVTYGRPWFGGTAGSGPFGSSSWAKIDQRFRLWSRRAGVRVPSVTQDRTSGAVPPLPVSRSTIVTGGGPRWTVPTTTRRRRAIRASAPGPLRTRVPSAEVSR
jgi:hypothetical protein